MFLEKHLSSIMVSCNNNMPHLDIPNYTFQWLWYITLSTCPKRTVLVNRTLMLCFFLKTSSADCRVQINHVMIFTSDNLFDRLIQHKVLCPVLMLVEGSRYSNIIFSFFLEKNDYPIVVLLDWYTMKAKSSKSQN